MNYSLAKKILAPQIIQINAANADTIADVIDGFDLLLLILLAPNFHEILILQLDFTFKWYSQRFLKNQLSFHIFSVKVICNM